MGKSIELNKYSWFRAVTQNFEFLNLKPQEPTDALALEVLQTTKPKKQDA